MLPKPDIRDMADGSVVVDYGRKWFRCYPNGEVIVKEVGAAGDDGLSRVESRPATSKERLLALADAAFGPLVK